MKKDHTERMVESLVHGVSFGVLCGPGVKASVTNAMESGLY